MFVEVQAVTVAVIDRDDPSALQATSDGLLVVTPGQRVKVHARDVYKPLYLSLTTELLGDLVNTLHY